MKFHKTFLFVFFIFLFSSCAGFSKETGPKATNPLLFRNLGPSMAGGRVTAVVGIPGNASIYYVGTAAGGVFKTENGGVTWKPIFADEATGSIGCLALSLSNPGEIWVGTGEANLRNDISAGKGIYFSPDGGRHWVFKGLADAGQIARIAVDPQNPQIIFVAALGHAWGRNSERGVFRSTDGGKAWKKVLFINHRTGACDLLLEPGNSGIVFAAMWEVARRPWNLENGGSSSGIYRSLDGGEKWEKLTKGLPSPPIGRIALAIAPGNPDHLYALVESQKGLLWDSKDGGDQWELVSNNHALDVRPFYFSRMEVSPRNENEVYFLSYNIMKTTDGGKTAKSISKGVHVDHHAIWIDPENPDRIIEGNDGGAYLSLDGGKSWRFLDNLPIEQFYAVSVDSSNPYRICGGLQDNGSVCGPSRSLFGNKITGADWIFTDDSDGQYVVPSRQNPNIIYEDFQNGIFERFNVKTRSREFFAPYLHDESEMSPAELKYRFNWTAPIAVSRTKPEAVYLGGNVLFRSRDGGAQWEVISPDLTRNDKTRQITSGGKVEHDISGAENYDTIFSISISPLNPDVIWVGTDDGLVQVTKNGGKDWENVTPAQLQPWGNMMVEASPFSASACLVAADRHKLDDNRPYLFKTTDFGKSWDSIAKGLPPDVPAHVVVEDPVKPDFLIAGTENGVTYSPDGGKTWKKLKANFPATPVYDLTIVKSTHDLVAGSHGRGIFVLDNLNPLENLDEAVKASPFHLFPLLPAYLFHQSGLEDAENPAQFAAPNPPAGLMIDYYIRGKRVAKKNSLVRIIISDQTGKAIRTYRVLALKGLNRFVWDLRYAPPAKLKTMLSEDEDDFKPLGPLVMPGEYKVTASFNGTVQSASAEIRMDPRYALNRQAYSLQVEETLQARDALSTLNTLLGEIYDLMRQTASIKTELQKDRSGKYKRLMAQLDKVSLTLARLRDSAYNPKRQRKVAEDGIHYLIRLHARLENAISYGESFFNEAPSPAVQAYISQEIAVLHRFASSYNQVLQQEVKSYNAAAKLENAPVLFP